MWFAVELLRKNRWGEHVYAALGESDRITMQGKLLVFASPLKKGNYTPPAVAAANPISRSHCGNHNRCVDWTELEAAFVLVIQRMAAP
jgi:hypothetical protein